MSPFVAFRRQAVDQQVASQLRTITMPAPTRGIIQNENEAYMQPGGCIVCDNWAPTMRGVKLRGGSILYCDLHSLDAPAWANNTAYIVGDRRYDAASGSFWECIVPHTSALFPISFAQDRTARANWKAVPTTVIPRTRVISAFEYVSSGQQRMFAGQQTKLFDVTNPAPVLVKSGQTSGNYVAAQLANAAANPLGTNWMIVCNDTGDPPLRYNGTTWTVLDPTAIGATIWANSTPYAINALVIDSLEQTYWKCKVAHTSASTGTFAADRIATGHEGYWTSAAAPDGGSYITGPIGSQVVAGRNLSYVWKYRNRLFFIESNSMNAWYLDINAIGGTLQPIPLAGAASRGGKLLFGASWSLDAGDGLDEKCLFVTDLGETLIFTGSNPSDPNNWRQQGRYQLGAPLGMNAHIQIGGDMMVLTVEGITPLSQAITKDAGQLELAMLTRTIKPLWRAEVQAKRNAPWTVKKWDEYGAVFVAVPGGLPGDRHCLLANNATGAWARFLGWDATCFLRLRADMFFGTQDGTIMQADRTGTDLIWDAFTSSWAVRSYVATLVGGWEMFGASANQIVWHQSRATFKSAAGEPFQPQLAATTDYNVIIPPAPVPGDDPGTTDVWDQGHWGPDSLWVNNRLYAVNDQAYDIAAGTIWRVLTQHTSAASGTFAADRSGAAAGKWAQVVTPSVADQLSYAQWDTPPSAAPPVRNTLWVSIGMTGYAHAPIVQVTVSQEAQPNVELIAIAATYEPAGVNV